MSPPWISLRTEGDRVIVEGDRAWSGGHRFTHPDSGTDEGIFASWTCAEDNTLTARNDRYGLKPLFYAYDEATRRLRLSPSLLRLLERGADAGFDDDAMSAYLRLGWFEGNTTPFKHIRVLPPNALFRWERGELTVEDRRPVPGPNNDSREVAVERYMELFRRAVEVREPAPGKSATLLSGGKDSRHVLAQQVALGRSPHMAVTLRRYKAEESDDLAVATRVTERLGLHHEFVFPEHSFTWYETRKNARAELCSDEHWWVEPIRRRLIALGVTTTWDGLAGDNLSAPRISTPADQRAYDEGRLDEVTESIVKRWAPSDAAVAALLPPGYAERWSRERAAHVIHGQLKSYANEVNPLRRFYFWGRMRRSVALMSGALLDGIERSYAPFLDHALHDYLGGLPQGMMYDGSFHAETVARTLPDLADIAYASDGSRGWSLGMALNQAVFSSVDLIRYAASVRTGAALRAVRWMGLKYAKRPGGGAPRRRVHYIIQLFDAAQGGAARQLGLLNH